MDEDRRRAKELVKQMSFTEKIKHYWSYYKKVIIVFIVAVAIVTWGVVQCTQVPEYDLKISVFVTTAYREENLARLAEYFEGYVDEINGDGLTDVFIQQKISDFTKDIVEPEDTVNLSKLSNELAADEYKVYIFDKPFMEHFEQSYGNLIETKFPLHEIPKMRELLQIDEKTEMYLVVTKMYAQSEEKEERVAEYGNARRVEAHMIELLQESKQNQAQ